jgi:hypothetical protein
MTWISESVRPLTSLESNAIQYMARCVAIKLLKTYQKPTKQLESQTSSVCNDLHEMQAANQPDVDKYSVC